MTVRYHRDALVELIAAAQFYEDRVPELGVAFDGEVARAERIIEEAPERWPEWPHTASLPPIRKYLLRSFPFALPYVSLDDGVLILAVAHLRREPHYWLGRIAPP